MAAISHGTSHVRTKECCKYTTSVDIQIALWKATVSHLEPNTWWKRSKSAREQRIIALCESNHQSWKWSCFAPVVESLMHTPMLAHAWTRKDNERSSSWPRIRSFSTVQFLKTEAREGKEKTWLMHLCMGHEKRYKNSDLCWRERERELLTEEK